MSESVDDPWRSNVDVRDMGDADFERRSTTISMWNKDGEVEPILTALAEMYDMSVGEIADRAFRLYLAHYLDSGEIDRDLREEYGITALIPPRGWMDDFDPIEVDVPDESTDRETIAVSVPPTVKEMVEDITEDHDELHNKNVFAVTALKWLAGVEDE